ncbi:MAG: hypothetical protein HC799_19385 [Limnothrix sp. RL_2_0]|nr:hypothetical protein [Limnothrix sp. RL_2_0]
MKTLIIENGIITGLGEGAATSEPPAGVEYRVVDSNLFVSMGWLVNGDTYTDPTPPPPPPDPVYNWAEFDDQLVSVLNPDSAYRQLTVWAKIIPAFLDCKTNIANAVTTKKLDRLQFAFADLKQTAISPNTFTPTQITEINSCLEALGVAWRWENLEMATLSSLINREAPVAAVPSTGDGSFVRQTEPTIDDPVLRLKNTNETTVNLGTSTTTETVTWDLSQGQTSRLIVNASANTVTLAVSNPPTLSYLARGELVFTAGTFVYPGLTLTPSSATPTAGSIYSFLISHVDGGAIYIDFKVMG